MAQRPGCGTPPRAGGAHDARLLRKLGIDLGSVQANVERAFGAGAWAGPERRRGHLPFARDAKQALGEAVRQATRLHSRNLQAAHVLRGFPP